LKKIIPVRLEVHVQPGSSRNLITGYESGVLKVKLTAPPVEGKANQKLVEFLADALDVPKSDIKVKTGLTGKHKLLEISKLSNEEVKERLERRINVP
jgi:uncharacterized protein